MDTFINSLRIPSIRDVRVLGKGFILSLLPFNVWVKKRELEFDSESSEINKYLKRQTKRLRRLAEVSPKRFWKVARFLIRNSRAFQVLALHKVIHNWYSSLPLEGVLNLMRNFDRIRKGRTYEYQVKEVEIPKPNGKKRTLSVPPKAWRMYLYLVNLIVVLYLNHRLNSNQYGHRPSGGVGKAWNKIISWLPGMKYVYEFDFKGFHPSISHNLLGKALESFKFPKEVVGWLLKLSDPTVITPQGKKIKRGLGVPQGVAISAMLGMIVLEYLKVYSMSGVEYIGYADDGMVGSDSDTDPIQKLKDKLAGTGLELNEEKSGWVIKEGVQVKPLKFLGCIWLNGELVSESRSGNSEKFEIGGRIPTWETSPARNPWEEPVSYWDSRKQVVGGPKYHDPKWLDYAKSTVGQWGSHGDLEEVKVYPKLNAVQAVDTPGHLETLMGTVWCNSGMEPDLSLTGVMGSMVDYLPRKTPIKVASSKAMKILITSHGEGLTYVNREKRVVSSLRKLLTNIS